VSCADTADVVAWAAMGARVSVILGAMGIAIVTALQPAAATAAGRPQPAAATTCTSRFSLVATPHPAGGTGLINGVSAIPGTGQAWAVGQQDQNNHTLPVVDRFRNSHWTAVTSPRPFQFTQLNAVSALGAKDAWAVGNASDGSATLAEHWDGHSWTVVPTPAGPGDLRGVAAVGPNDVWAVGEDFTTTAPLVEHWDGHTWSTVSVFDPFPAVEIFLTDVQRVRGTGRLWAVGPFTSYQFAGGTWTYRQMPGFADVSSLTVPAAGDAWAVGGSGTGGITEHFTGTAWHKFFTKGVYLSLVGSVSPNDIWATWSAQLAGPPRFAHLAGGRWHLLGGVPGFAFSSALAIGPAGTGWAAGQSSASQPQLVRLCGL
jgi:hypothetical protein